VSYSRWSHSEWYTYWAISDAAAAYDEIFCVCGGGSFTYGELVENIDACLKKVDGNDELKGYMKCFTIDVEKKYSRDI